MEPSKESHSLCKLMLLLKTPWDALLCMLRRMWGIQKAAVSFCDMERARCRSITAVWLLAVTRALWRTRRTTTSNVSGSLLYTRLCPCSCVSKPSCQLSCTPFSSLVTIPRSLAQYIDSEHLKFQLRTFRESGIAPLYNNGSGSSACGA